MNSQGSVLTTSGLCSKIQIMSYTAGYTGMRLDNQTALEVYLFEPIELPTLSETAETQPESESRSEMLEPEGLLRRVAHAMSPCAAA